ncbi:MAG: hypothetical protein CMH56_05450 [Myxococcales bacterium]|nr:hypothetical protein [Myxococcales bacterium]|tara:strand:+ start:544 stop:1341 length:798 start_codon:yes stop_codon:yes gene_type:complete
MNKKNLLGLVFLSALLSCAEPAPEAPDDIEELMGFLYEHYEDEDDGALYNGLTKLGEWLADDDNRAAATEAFTFTELPETAVDDLDERERKTDKLKGHGVLTLSPHKVEDIATLLGSKEFENLYKDKYDEYERHFEMDTDCFADKTCDRVTGTIHAVSSWLGGAVSMTTDLEVGVRWVETDAGWMALNRSWLLRPAFGSCCDFVLEASYYIAAIMPDGNGAMRMHASWAELDYGSVPIPEEEAASRALQTTIDDSANTDEYLSNR